LTPTQKLLKLKIGDSLKENSKGQKPPAENNI